MCSPNGTPPGEGPPMLVVCIASLIPPIYGISRKKKFSISQITRRKSFASFSSSSSNFMFSPFFLKFQRVFFFSGRYSAGSR